MLSDEIDRYLLSLVTVRSPQTVSWYRKRLQPLRSLEKNISAITLIDLQSLYADLATRSERWLNFFYSPPPVPYAPSQYRGASAAGRLAFDSAHVTV